MGQGCLLRKVRIRLTGRIIAEKRSDMNKIESRILHALVAAAALFAAAATSSCIADEPENMESLLNAGDHAPQLRLELSDGSEFIGPPASGRPAVILFFSTGCSDCRRELPAMDELHRRLPQLPMVAVARRQTADAIAPYWEENGLTIPYSGQADAAVYSLFARAGIPRVYLLDSSGRVVAEYFDSEIPDVDALEAECRRL